VRNTVAPHPLSRHPRLAHRCRLAAGVDWALHSWSDAAPFLERELRGGRASLGYRRARAAARRVRHIGSRSAHPDARDRRGYGDDSLWLAERGFDVLGIDIAPLAVERANAKLNGRDLGCSFATLDFLAASPDGGPFRFIFDRGCFHVFDEPEERARFSARVAAALAPGGLWLSLVGSTEGPPREVGSPRRSAREVILAVEPALEILGEEHGFEAIEQHVFQNVVGGMFSARDLKLHDVAIYVNGAAAWSEFHRDFHATLRKYGSAVTTHGVETQIYRKEEGKWRLVQMGRRTRHRRNETRSRRAA
jgi:hypothetical protein